MDEFKAKVTPPYLNLKILDTDPKKLPVSQKNQLLNVVLITVLCKKGQIRAEGDCPKKQKENSN